MAPPDAFAANAMLISSCRAELVSADVAVLPFPEEIICLAAGVGGAFAIATAAAPSGFTTKGVRNAEYGGMTWPFARVTVSPKRLMH